MIEVRQKGQEPTETGWWYRRMIYQRNGHDYSDPSGCRIYPVFVQMFKNGKCRVDNRQKTDVTGSYYYERSGIKRLEARFEWFGPVTEIKELV